MGVVVGSRTQAEEYAAQVRRNEKLLAEVMIAGAAVALVVASAAILGAF